MKTPMIVGLTVLGTVGVFTAGGVVATQFMKQTMQSLAPTYAPEVSRNAFVIENDLPAAAAPVAVAEPTLVAAAVPAPVAPAPEPEPATAAILQTLIAQQTQAATSDDVVLYDFVSAQQSANQFEAAIPENLTFAVVEALRAGRSVDDLEQMISSAADLGLINAPAALSTSEGAPDARAILLSIMTDHEAATGESFEVESLDATAAIDAPTRNQLYVVESGDSLAFIALKFYGDTEEYRVIFNANRSKIVSPDRIRVGQRLIIPAI